jgi:phosphatidylserine decarboxylase
MFSSLPTPSVWLQYLYPKLALTQLMGRLARAQGGAMTHWTIERFVQRYRVDMGQAQEPNPKAYASFNDFFTRSLKPGLRPISSANLCCPVDGAVSQCGDIQAGRIFQAKGRDYSAAELLASTEQARAYEGGRFATIYLSPRDYHRIHMPCSARLLRMTHVPGDLFSVNPTTAQGVPRLFARNERVVCEFTCDFGPMALVLVGATIVGSMATVWHGTVNPPRTGQIRQWDYSDQEIVLNKGDEMGRFMLGSTVVLLFPKDTVAFTSDFVAQAPVRMGQTMGI